MTTPDRDALRIELLEHIYDLVESSTGGRMTTWVNYEEWSQEQGYDFAAVDRAQEWLRDRGLVKHPVMGPRIEITPAGQDEVERIRRERTTASAQQLIFVTPEQVQRLEPFIREVMTVLEQHGDDLDPDDAADLQAQVDTIAAQTKSPRPRRNIVQAAVDVIKVVAAEAGKGVVGGAAFQGLVVAASRIF